MDTTFLVVTIIFANGYSMPLAMERTVFDAVCHGRALHWTQFAAAKGESVRYSCRKSILGDRMPAKEG